MADIDGALILFGGSVGDTTFGDTWKWDGVSWTLVTDAGPTPSRSLTAGAEADGTFIIFGGFTNVAPLFASDTWAFNGGDWTNLNVSGPSARWGMAMTAL